MSKVRGIRGATTANSNEKDEVFNATSEMLAELVKANDIDADDVAAAFFTTTPDLNADFPAAAARLMGGRMWRCWTRWRLMCRVRSRCAFGHWSW